MMFDPLQSKLDKSTFLHNNQMPWLIMVITMILTVSYFFYLLFFVPIGNTTVFIMLMIGEVFHVWQVGSYLYTIRRTEVEHDFDHTITSHVDIFITVAGEPVDLVRQTAIAAKAMIYSSFDVYLLNDGYVAGKENWRDIELLAQELGIHCITRTIPGGAKAGNINHALSKTQSEFFVVFDADHVPHQNFLEKTMGYFTDSSIAFVQTPQFYKNASTNRVTRGSWSQQEIFFGAICKGKNDDNAVFMCGTNMVVRRNAIEQVGGMCEFNIAEDFLTSLFIHQKGWKSVYVPQILAEGLAPEDFLSYYKQQFRWARGSLEVIFRYNPLFMSGMTWKQKFHYLASASYYLSGFIVLLNMMLPLLFLYFGYVPITLSTMALATLFLPYIFMVMYMLQRTTNYTYTFEALAFSIGSFVIHIKALFAVIINKKSTFNVTSKTQVSGNFLYLNTWHLVYIVLFVCGFVISFYRESLSPSLVTNVSWVLLNIVVFTPFIRASLPDLRPVEPVQNFTGESSISIDKY